MGDVQFWYYTAGLILSVAAILGGLVRIVIFLRRLSEQFVRNGGGSLRDAIDRLEANLAVTQRAVMFAAARLRLLAQHSACGEWESDPEGGCVAISAGMTTLTGYPAEFWLGSNWVSAVVEDDRERVVAEWASCVASHRRFDMRYRFSTAIGSCIMVRGVAMPVVADGVCYGWVGEFCRTADEC